MRKFVFGLVVIGLCALQFTVTVAGELESNYDEVICSYFHVKQAVVDEVRAAGLNDEDIPVAIHIAKRGKSSPVQIAALRARGDDWAGIVRGRGMNVEIFYIPVSGDIESFTYAPLLGQFRATPTRQWNKMPLSDSDVVNLVNLRLAASGYTYDIFKVMGLRDEGKGFVQICHEVKEAKDVLVAEHRSRTRAVANAGL